MAKPTSAISCLDSLPPPQIHRLLRRTTLHLPSLSSLPLPHVPPLHLRARTDPSTHIAARNSPSIMSLLSACLALSTLASPASAAELASLSASLQEPANALSLPTWAVHVSSVVEWITAMALVWQYGEVSGYESWKGLSWGMVPLLGGAFCACTWHFFYNSESLEVLVALQAAMTVLGNATMCFAAFRIYRASEGCSRKL